MSAGTETRIGGYIEVGGQLLTQHEYDGGIRSDERTQARRWKEVEHKPTDVRNVTAAWLGEQRADPRIPQRQREVVQLRAAAPLRKPVEQAPVDGLSLFDAARSPGMF